MKQLSDFASSAFSSVLGIFSNVSATPQPTQKRILKVLLLGENDKEKDQIAKALIPNGDHSQLDNFSAAISNNQTINYISPLQLKTPMGRTMALIQAQACQSACILIDLEKDNPLSFTEEIVAELKSQKPDIGIVLTLFNATQKKLKLAFACHQKLFEENPPFTVKQGLTGPELNAFQQELIKSENNSQASTNNNSRSI